MDLLGAYWKNEDKNGNMCFNFYRRDYIEDEEYIGVHHLRYGESPLALYATAGRAYCIKDELYKRRFREGSDITSPWNQVKLESLIIQLMYDIDFVRRKVPDLEHHMWLMNFFLQTHYGIYSAYYENDLVTSKPRMLADHADALFYYHLCIRNGSPDNVYCELLDTKKMDELKASGHLWVYGGGRVTGYVISKLERYGITDYDVVSTSGSDKAVCGKNVISVRSIKEGKNDPVLMAVGWGKQGEIKTTLEKYGFSHVVDVTGI